MVLPPREESLGYGASTMRGTPCHLVVRLYCEDTSEEETLEKIIRNRLADGGCCRRLPFVIHGRTELATPHPWVDYDNFSFARAAVEWLVTLGVRRPGLVPAHPAQTFSRHLRLGFLRGCGEPVAYLHHLQSPPPIAAKPGETE